MTTKHTPGPWKWTGNLLISQQEPNDVVLREHNYFARSEADKRLIEAAPDLMEACELWISGESTWSTIKAREMASRAILKIKGEIK